MTKSNLLKIGKSALIFILIISIVSVSMSFIGGRSSDEKQNLNGISAIGTPDKLKSPLADKYISFLGDSITTYEGWSNSTSYNTNIGNNAVYYNSSSGLSVNDTWWKQLINKNDMRLCVNDSWSASRLTQNGNIPYLLNRIPKIENDNLNITPDIVVIYLGTNDIANDIFTETTLEDVVENYNPQLVDWEGLENPLWQLYVSCLEIKQRYSNIDIFVCTILPESRSVDKQTELEFFNEQVCKLENLLDGVFVVDLFSDSGITYDNYMNYTIDDGSLRVHPNRFGMDLITNCVQATFERVYGF